MEPVLDSSKARPVPKPQKQIVLYWPSQEMEIWRTFKRSMENEGDTSASEQIRFWVKEWYRKHAPGNPQTPLERFKVLPVSVEDKNLRKDSWGQMWEKLEDGAWHRKK